MKNLKQTDPEVYQLLNEERRRQEEVLEMIPSENYASSAVREALSSELTNKYSEGYPKKRYYQGNKIADSIETLAIERAKRIFGVPYVNVQAYSGSPANTAIYFALLEPQKDKIMGLSLSFGGHLTHGASVSFAGKYFKTIPYTLNKKGYVDFQEVEELAIKEKPKIIVCGFTAYPRIVEFEKFAKIAQKVNAYLLADISHIGGLVAGNAHPSPASYADIIMTTTHKTLRGPRGAIIMVTEKGLRKNPDLPSLIDKAVFPGLQGGPHDNQTAAIAVALHEASTNEFQQYALQVVKNSQTLAEDLRRYGFELVSDGTDNHLLLIDLRNKNINGALAAFALEVAGIVVNKNAVPFDTNPPFYPSGIRLGTPALTSRGMKQKDMKKVAEWIREAIEAAGEQILPQEKEKRNEFVKRFKKEAVKNKELLRIAEEIKEYTKKFPLP